MESHEYILSRIREFFEDEISKMDEDNKITIINNIKLICHENSPFKNEPVDCVLWVKNDKIIANDYNPNKVAPPEMELLEVSIMNDGYTQPKSEAYEKYKSIKNKRKIAESL